MTAEPDRAPNNGFRIRGTRRGAAYVLALTTLLVGTTLGLAMLRAAIGHFLAEESRAHKQAAANLAEAGINYAYWQVKYQGELLPYVADRDLETGSFHVEAIDDSDTEPGTALITSTGTSGKHRYTMRRVVAADIDPLPYDYAWCQNTSLITDQPIFSLGPSPGMHVNGSISLTNSNTMITSGAWATGSISTTGTVSPRHPDSSPVAFPSIDYDYYDSVATHRFWDDKNFSSLDYPAGAVIMVDGGVNMRRGDYRGVVTIVATGPITVTGNVTRADADSFLALITERSIVIEGNTTTLQAVLYCHNESNTGLARYSRDDPQGSGTTVTGSVAADNIRMDGTSTANRDPTLTRDVMAQLKLPGL